MKDKVKELSKRLELEIHKTPSGELRNLLTDANILLLYFARQEQEDEYKEICKIMYDLRTLWMPNTNNVPESQYGELRALCALEDKLKIALNNLSQPKLYKNKPKQEEKK